jgi:hypothetical protein
VDARQLVVQPDEALKLGGGPRLGIGVAVVLGLDRDGLVVGLPVASAWRPVSMSCQMWPSADPERRPRMMKWLSIPVRSWKYYQATTADPTIEWSMISTGVIGVGSSTRAAACSCRRVATRRS